MNYSEASYKFIFDEQLGPDAVKLPHMFLQGLVETERGRQERQATLPD